MPSDKPPAWAAQAVWYQIFPERFRNGDPKNDPVAADVVKAWPFFAPPGWCVSSWTGDWYKLQPWESGDARGFYVHVGHRRYGGDLQGVLDKLDYLVDLGVTALYFNPLFESPSPHKYDASCYHHIDRHFGPDPEGDARIEANEDPANPSTWQWTSADRLFLHLIAEVHKHGMKIVLDGVFNHVGTTFWAFQDVRKRGPASPYRDWFTILSWDNPETPRDEFDYQSWMGVRDLPELREDAGGIVPGPREYIKAVVRRWMDPDGDGKPADGIDGWRLDVAEKVGIPFWREFHRWVRDVNPDAYLTGEVWWEDWSAEKMFNAAPWLQGDVFDAVMNYRWAREACHFFKDKQSGIATSVFDRRLAQIRSDYPEAATHVLMNLYGSHDTDRLASMIVNVDSKFDKQVGPKDNPQYNVRKPAAAEQAVQRLMAFFQMTYIGAPMIYYGDEAGMWGGDDPDCRKPMLWADLHYENEATHPFGKERPSDPNVFDVGLHAYYKKLIALRRAHPALSEGTYTTLKAADNAGVLVFERSHPTEQIVVAVNRSSGEEQVAIAVPAGSENARLRDLDSDRTVAPAKGNWILLVPAVSGVAYRIERN
jgi:glycosidase